MMEWKPHLKALLEIKTHQLTWRSSILGTLCTSAPFIIGLIVNRPIDGMLASILGMLMMLNDAGGNLRQRLSGQVVLIGALLLGAAISTMIYFGALPGDTWQARLIPFVLVLLLFAILAGWAQGSGKRFESFSRNIALALIVVTEIPQVDITMKLFFMGSAALSIAARWIDHGMNPRTVDDDIQPLLKNIVSAYQGNNAGLRYASVYGVSIVMGLLLGVVIGTSKPYWVAITVMMTMRPDAELNFIRTMQRIIGTLIGIGAAAVIVQHIESTWLIAAIVVVIGFALPHGFPMNYGIHCSLLALFIMVLYSVAMTHYGDGHYILRERIYDVLLGCAIALIGNAIAFPRKTLAKKVHG